MFLLCLQTAVPDLLLYLVVCRHTTIPCCSRCTRPCISPKSFPQRCRGSRRMQPCANRSCRAAVAQTRLTESACSLENVLLVRVFFYILFYFWYYFRYSFQWNLVLRVYSILSSHLKRRGMGTDGTAAVVPRCSLVHDHIRDWPSVSRFVMLRVSAGRDARTALPLLLLCLKEPSHAFRKSEGLIVV